MRRRRTVLGSSDKQQTHVPAHTPACKYTQRHHNRWTDHDVATNLHSFVRSCTKRSNCGWCSVVHACESGAEDGSSRGFCRPSNLVSHQRRWFFNDCPDEGECLGVKLRLVVTLLLCVVCTEFSLVVPSSMIGAPNALPTFTVAGATLHNCALVSTA